MKFDRIDHQAPLVRSKVVQFGYLGWALLQYLAYKLLKKDAYAAHDVALRYERIAGALGWKTTPVIGKINARLVSALKREAPENRLVGAYLKSHSEDSGQGPFEHYDWEHQVRLKHPRHPDEPTRQGNLLLLKPPLGNGEKGVLLIKYNYAFKKFISLYDPNRVAERFRLVLEPSYWGYRDAGLLLYIGIGTDVIVQAQDRADYDYIASLQSNLIPLKLGSGDWVDPELFHPGSPQDKVYDLVMVASWIRMKRHRLLFSVMRECEDAIQKVALVGYPIEGRKKEDILSEASLYGVAGKLDIYDSVSRQQTSDIIRRSKIGLMLSLREGANKGMYECFFSGVPMIISSGNIGINREHINPATGVTASDADLPATVRHLLHHLDQYDPRRWALEHTGYKNATAILNATLKTVALRTGEPWTQDIYAKKNDINAKYVDELERSMADRAMADLKDLLRTS